MAEENTSNIYIAQDRRPVIGAALTGFFVGAVGWLVNMAIQAWIIEPIFCRSTQTYNVCANGGTVAWTVALIIVSIVGLLGLVRTGVFRPLLVVLATLRALWGVSAWLGPLPWWQSLLWHGVLFALSYSLFAWIARVQSFLLSLIVTVVVIIVTRFVVLNS